MITNEHLIPDSSYLNYNFGSPYREEIKNRLILVGNGFDISHGLNTRFSDFIKSYISESINSLFRDLHFEDELISLKKVPDFGVTKRPEPTTVLNSMDILKKLQSSSKVEIVFKSSLLSRCVNNTIELNWVNIEALYFEDLVSANSGKSSSPKVDKIKKLNDELGYLKEKLIQYLRNENKKFIGNFNKSPIIDCFCEEIFPKEVVTIEMSKNVIPENLYFLSFNYTTTLESYVHECNKKIKSDINYIHGNLGGEKGNPIIGFGDEFDKRYLEFEDQQNNELFKHIKSFEYLQTDNYYNLLRFVDSGLFQVHIYGHSCGITDRTMLNHIFEHVNCKSIKIFYHKKDDGSDDFTEKTFEISRHFKIKGDMREKIIPYKFSKPMPQLNFMK